MRLKNKIDLPIMDKNLPEIKSDVSKMVKDLPKSENDQT